MAITFTPEAIRDISISVYDGVLNRRDPLKVDRTQYPLLSMLNRRIDSAPLAGADGVKIKYKVQSNLDIQGWERKDVLTFDEQSFLVDTQFPWSNIHQGVEIVHDDLEAMGYVVLPNGSRGKNFAKADTKSEAYNKFDVNTDLLMHRNNSYNPKLPQGLDAYWPIALGSTGMVSDADGIRGYYNVGTVGGKSRSAWKDVLQHYIWMNATVSAGGSLAVALETAKREAELRSRGRSKGGVKAILAGARAIDGYKKYARNNNLRIETSAGGTPKLDIGIADSAIQFLDIPIIHDPTFEMLDLLEPGNAVPWTNRFYLIDPESLCVAYAPGKNKVYSAPMDEASVRVTRGSIDSKLVFLPKILNGSAVVSIAA
jgi:hypothetical protein